jgi:putative transposase
MEILALRHQITVLERQLGADRVKFAPEDRAFLAALLASLPRQVLRRLRLLVRPDTVLRWHRDLMNQRHARTLPTQAARASAHRPLDTRPRPAPGQGEPKLGYRRVHGELATSASRSPPRPSGRSSKGRGHRPRARAQPHDLGRLPALPSGDAARLRLHRDRHPDRAAPVHPRGDRAREPPDSHPRHHRTSDRGLGDAGRQEPRDGSRGRGLPRAT